MRSVWLGGLTATERWPRLVGSLAVSVAVHYAALNIAGLMAFRLLPQQEGSRPAKLMVDLLSNLPPAKSQAVVESMARAVVAPVASVDVGVQHVESPHADRAALENVSNLPSTVDAARPQGLFPGPWYYAARYLHRRPTPLKPIRPVYPSEAENLSGQVVLLLLINERGTVDSYQIIESQPAGRFDDSVIAAFTRETYAPGLITGYPVKSQLLVEVRFEPGSLPQADVLPDLAPFNIQVKPVPLVKQR